MAATARTVRTETAMSHYPDKWVPTGEFVRDYPELASTPAKAHRLSARRFKNGMDEMAVVKKKRGFGLRWNPANFARWIEEYQR